MNFSACHSNLWVFFCRAKGPCKLSGCSDTKSSRTTRICRLRKSKKFSSPFSSLNSFKSYEITTTTNLMMDCFRCRCSKLKAVSASSLMVRLKCSVSVEKLETNFEFM